MKGTLWKKAFTGDLVKYVKQGSEMDICFHRGPVFWGNMDRRFFLRAFLIRGIFMRFSRDIQIPCKWVSLSTGVLLGNLEGVRLAGVFFYGKEKVNLGSFLGPRGH